MVTAKTKKVLRKKAAERRRERHAELAREDILAAAAAAFAERGYRDATVQDIASRAGYTPASLYTYFKGKAEIFNALVDSVVVDVEAVFGVETDPEIDFGSRLEDLIRGLLETTETHRHSVVYFMNLQERGGSRPGVAGRSMPDMLVAVEAWFEKNATARDLPNVPVREAAVLFWSVLGGVVRLWAVSDADSSLADQAPRLSHFMLNGFQGKPPGKR